MAGLGSGLSQSGVTRPQRTPIGRDTRFRFLEHPNDLALTELRFPHDRSFEPGAVYLRVSTEGEAYDLTCWSPIAELSVLAPYRLTLGSTPSRNLKAKSGPSTSAS